MANQEWLRTGIDGVSFGERLGDLINNKGINQSQLSDETGIKQSAISEYLNGKQGGTILRAPDCATVISLAKYFSVSTDYLLGLTDVKTPNPNIKGAVELTGLSENTIKVLSNLRNWQVNEESEIIDILVSDCVLKNIGADRSHRSILNLLSFFFSYSSNSKIRKQVFSNGLIVDRTSDPSFISSNAIALDDTVIENAVLAEIQQALISLKKNRKKEYAEQNGND